MTEGLFSDTMRDMKLTPKIQKAIEKAAILHHGQERKIGGIPYIIHPFSTAFILGKYTDDEDIISAALLHDVLEDVKGYGEQDLKNDFGERVARIVKEVSEDKISELDERTNKETWQERKEKYLKNLMNDSYEALMVCAADKMHNLISNIDSYQEYGDEIWDKFNAPKDKKAWFVRQIINILHERLNNQIVEDLEEVYRRSRKMFLE